jgi:hypothetical protein
MFPGLVQEMGRASGQDSKNLAEELEAVKGVLEGAGPSEG